MIVATITPDNNAAPIRLEHPDGTTPHALDLATARALAAEAHAKRPHVYLTAFDAQHRTIAMEVYDQASGNRLRAEISYAEAS
ncbi:MAG: hypothetical protein Q4G35_08275 [Propionibacteriaceae bacterium]|nr:hypothetical protein [Propionibacteriaceae bacterium]